MQRHDHVAYLRTAKRESVYGAWNRGVRIARGNYFINANTDDRFADDALEKMAAILDDDIGVHAVYGDWLQTTVENDTFDSPTVKNYISYPQFDPLLLFHSQITSHAALIRRQVFDQIGLYDDSFRVYGDREFMLRFSANGLTAKKMAAVVGLYYKNPRGLEFSEPQAGEYEYVKILDRFLAPDVFIGLCDEVEAANKKKLARLYTRAGAIGKDFFEFSGRAVSNLGTAGILFGKALEFDGANPVALNNLGIIASIGGDTVIGSRLFEKALAASEPDQRSYIRTNIKRAQKGTNRLRAYKWCYIDNSKQKENVMKSAEEMYQEIQPLIENGWYDVAARALEKLSEAYPDFAVAYNDLGVLYYKSGDKHKAQVNYEKAAELQPENITFQKNLADYYYVESGRVEDALKIYVKVLSIHPEDVETLLITGHICVALQNFDDARDFYQRVVEIEPWHADAGRNLEKLEKILSGDSPKPDLTRSADEMYQTAHSAMKAGRSDEAISKLEALVETFPDHAMAHNDLGVLYYNTGDKKRAGEYYLKAAELKPEDVTFQKNLADFYCIELGQYEKAMQIYVQVLERFSEDVEAMLAIGYICEAVNKPDDAREFYQRVVDIEPWNTEARQKLDNLHVVKQAV